MPLYEPGQRLSHYRLQEKIGQGGMGVVYRALDTRLNRPVAIKVLPPEVTDDSERRRRFLHEARAAAAVTHGRIATVHDVDEAEGAIFIVMELVDGRSLRSLIGKDPMPIPRALAIATEIADGLAHAHEAHIVHRDLKPENVIIDKDGHAKILDFGLARLVEQRQEDLLSQASQADTVTARLTREGQILGTTAYMSPEQARGAPVDERSDLFALGVVLYELVTGRRPFQGATAIETLSAILKDDPAPASRWNKAVAPGLDDLIRRCLRKDPAERCSSAAAVRDDLERLCAASGTASGERPAAAAKPRSRSAIALWGTAAGIVAAGIVVTLVFRHGPSAPSTVQGQIHSLAVLPLRNLSQDPEQEYFADGMTDELITQLSRISALRVISRSSSMRFKGATRPASEIARELKVDALVEGSVQRSGDRVRVSASLVEAGTDSSVWAESYERDLRDVLSLQSDVAGAIARRLQARLTEREQGQLAVSRRVDPEAYQLYLRGRQEWNKATRATLLVALECFQKALDIDPGYAPAYLGMAAAYYDLSGLHMASTVALPKARAAARKAIELDSELAEPHATLANVAMGLDYDWPGAEEEFRRALDLSPSDARTHNYYGLFLSHLGRTDEAADHLRQAQDLDPLSPWIAVGVAWPFIYAPPGRRDYSRAVGILKGVIETAPDFVGAHVNLAIAYSLLGKCDRAMEEVDKTVALAQGEIGFRVWLASVEATCGARDRAREALRLAQESGRPGQASPFLVALVHAALGDNKSTLRWLETAFEERDELIALAMVEPRLDGLRSEPAFVDLLRRLHFPGAQECTIRPAPVSDAS